MDEYDKLSRAELIQRLEALESAKASAAASQAAPPDDLSFSRSRESEERLRAILQTAVEGIITIDEHGAIESLNPAAERLFGWKAEELRGKSVNLLMPSPYREEHDGYLANYLRSRMAKIIGIGREVVGLRRDGTVFPMDLAVSEVRLPERLLFTGFVRDISERKKAEARLEDLARSLAEKNKELETIVYAASHDLRSPLVNIQGFSKELGLACEELRARLLGGSAQPGLPPEARLLLTEDIPEALEYIQTGVAKMDTLLTGFLRFSRLGRAALKLEPLNMNAILGEIARAMKFQLEQTGATLRLEDLPRCIGDATQISRVFANLLDNALKYLDPKRPGLIAVSGRVESGRSLYAVRDNGIGIAPEHQPRVFEIFHRLNPASGEGEGLGLTIAQRILERHNGKIWVESVPGQGSTFWVALPHPEPV